MTEGRNLDRGEHSRVLQEYEMQGQNYETAGFDNVAFHSEQSCETPLNVSRLSSRDWTSPEAQDRSNNGRSEGTRREYSHNIRELALWSSHGISSDEIQGRSKHCTDQCESCGWIIVIIILLATMAPSAFVFYQIETQKPFLCNTQDPLPVTQKVERAVDDELRKLSEQVKELHEKVIQYESNSKQCPPVNDREARRMFAMLWDKTTKVAGEVRDMEKNLTDQTSKEDEYLGQIQKLIQKLESKISNMTKQKAKCVFKKHSSQTGNRQVNLTVSKIDEKQKNGAKHIGVTCCADTLNISQNYSGLLTAVEEGGNITYTCHCFSQRTCYLCYWECH